MDVNHLTPLSRSYGAQILWYSLNYKHLAPLGRRVVLLAIDSGAQNPDRQEYLYLPSQFD
jgi:hypothetical protein